MSFSYTHSGRLHARWRPSTFQSCSCRHVVRPPQVARQCFLDLPEAELPASLNLAPDGSLLELQHYMGGPPPFGIGSGIMQLEDQRQQVPLPPPNEQLEEALQRRLRHELRQMARDFGRPLDELSSEQQTVVQEERLRLTLGKFWGLMHEEDRPWHRPLIIHLCCQLPANTRRLYLKLRPSTMQYTIAQRSKAEKELHELHSSAQRLQRRRAWLLQQEQQKGISRNVELKELRQQVRNMKADTGRVLSTLKELCRLAWASFQDQDYLHYNEQQLQPVACQLADWCDDYIQATGKGDRDAAARGGDTVYKQLLLKQLKLPAYQAAVWRYPPLQYASSGGQFKSRGLRASIRVPVRQGSNSE